MRVLDPAWPPIANGSTTRASRPSDDAYTAAAMPAGPAPTITTSNPVWSRSVRMRVPYSARSSGRGSTSGVPSSNTTTGTSAPCLVAGGEELEPSAESGVWNACGTPFRASRFRSAEPRGDHGSATTVSSRLAGRVLPPPLLQELRDQAMEDLVRRAERLDRVVVDVARAPSRCGSHPPSPRPPSRPTG